MCAYMYMCTYMCVIYITHAYVYIYTYTHTYIKLSLCYTPETNAIVSIN